MEPTGEPTVGEEPPGTGWPCGGDLGVLLALTATELEVLEAAHLAGLTRSRPATVGEAAGAAGVEAIRSLTARGLLTREGRIREDDPLGRLAQTVLDVRLGAGTVILVERLLGGQADGPTRDLRMLHVLPDGAVVEDVHPDGVHGLDLVLGPDLLVRAVTDMVVPPGAADPDPGPGAEVVLAADRAEQLPTLLDHPTVLTELTLLRDGDLVEGQLLALGPRGCWAAPRRPGPLGFRRVPAERVASIVTGWLAGVGGTMGR